MSLILAQNPNAMNDLPVPKQIGNKKIEAFVNTSVSQRRVYVQISPSSAISSNVISGGSLEYRLENNVDRITSCYLRVDYTNSSGADFVCSCGPAQIRQIEIFSNNGATLLYQTTSAVANFLIDAVNLSRTEWNTTASMRATTAETYATGVQTIPNGQSGSLFYSIAPQFWRSLKLRSYTIDGNFLIKIKFKDPSTIIQSGTFTTTSANLQFTGYMEDDKQKQVAVQRASVPKALAYYAPQQHLETLNLSPSSTYNVRLSGINGWVNTLYFVVRAVADATSPNNVFRFYRPYSYDFLDPSSSSITGFKQQLSNFDQVIIYSHQFDNEFINHTGACVYSFSQSPASDMATGAWHGGVEMRGSHYLQITTEPNLPAGSYEVHVYAMCNETLVIEKAQVRSTRH